MASSALPILEARALVKKFPGVIALRGVTFDIRPGEIHALCGENGAGKSTLIKTLSGIHPAGTYEGEIVTGGKIAAFGNTRDAEAAGIAVIFQELALVPEMTVAENICLGTEPRRLGGLAVDWEKVQARATAVLAPFKLDISPDARVIDLGIGQRQLVEIAKALSKKSKVLILDEPTAALSEREVEVLLNILRGLREQGMAIVYISHKLPEVFALADRITILRDGASVGTWEAHKISREEVIKNMVGRELGDLFPRRITFAGEPLLTVKNLSVAGDDRTSRRGMILKNISFQARAGEVLGIGGLMGAGRTELLMHLIGAMGRRVEGTVRLDRTDLGPGTTPASAIASGLVLVSEDRRKYGLVLDRSIGFNLSLSSLSHLTKGPTNLSAVFPIDDEVEVERNLKLFRDLRVKAPSLVTAVGTLSGGNQQKVVIGKALMTSPKVVLLDEPTRGIDVGAKVEVYNLMNDLTSADKAVILVSSELPELIGMSDRIIMLADGEIGGEFARGEATQEKLMAAALGR